MENEHINISCKLLKFGAAILIISFIMLAIGNLLQPIRIIGFMFFIVGFILLFISTSYYLGGKLREEYHKGSRVVKTNKANQSFYEVKNFKNTTFQNASNETFNTLWKLIVFIVIILMVSFILLKVSSNNSSGSWNVNIFTKKDNNLLTTTHKTTSIGSGGIITEEHTCPFWNRDC